MGQSALTMCNAADTATDDLIVPSLDQSSPAKAPEVNKEAETEARLAEEQRKEEYRQKAEAKKAAEEEAVRKREGEYKLKAEEEKRRLERQNRKEEARVQQRLQEVAARQAEERAAETERTRQEAEKARLKQEELDAQKMVDEFLTQKRFKGITVLRKGICGVPTLPLHTAIEDGEVELVRALLRCGADPEQKASGKSAMQVAERCNKKGSHDLVVTALRGGMAASHGGA